MDRKTRIAVVLNAASGDGSAEAAQALLAARFRDAGIDAQITLIHSADELQTIVTAAIADEVTALVAGGGDGTVNAVANAIADREIALGIVPLGTLNHFAKDLGIPADPAAAADVIAAGHTVRVDVGEVNGRRFLNNSSVGLYPRIVELRTRYRARGFKKMGHRSVGDMAGDFGTAAFSTDPRCRWTRYRAPDTVALHREQCL